MKTKTAVIVAASFALGILFDILFFGHTPGISVLIYIAAITGGLFLLSSHHKRQVPKSVKLLLLPLGFFAGMVAIRASHLLTFLNIVAIIVLLLLIARIMLGESIRRFMAKDYFWILLLPLDFIRPAFNTISDFLSFRSSPKNPVVWQVIRGILIAVPVLIVFSILFSSADLVFGKYASRLFTVHISDVTLAHVLVILVTSIAFIGAFGYIFSQLGQPNNGNTQSPKQRIGKVETTILLTSVNVLFLCFITVQLAYLFGGLTNIKDLGFTYAEYARKGFFELLSVAIIVFGLLWITDKYTAKTTDGHNINFKILSSVLIVQVLLIMVSAFKRLHLYEIAFGYTTLRLYSHIFVIFLTCIFVLLLLKIINNRLEYSFTFPAFALAIVFLTGINLLNPDAFIARQNLDRYKSTGKIDGVYLGGLSEDAWPIINNAVTNEPSWKFDRLISGRYESNRVSNDWQSWNLARLKKK